jgi:hypothetical protein
MLKFQHRNEERHGEVYRCYPAVALSAYVWTGSKPNRTEPNPAEYTLTIHVSACHLVAFSLGMLQVLDVLIDRKKYELQSNSNTGVLAPGDYKAKLVLTMSGLFQREESKAIGHSSMILFRTANRTK